MITFQTLWEINHNWIGDRPAVKIAFLCYEKKILDLLVASRSGLVMGFRKIVLFKWILLRVLWVFCETFLSRFKVRACNCILKEFHREEFGSECVSCHCTLPYSWASGGRSVHCTLSAQKGWDFQSGKDLRGDYAHSSRPSLSYHLLQSSSLPSYRHRSQHLKLPATWSKWHRDIWSEPWGSVLHKGPRSQQSQQSQTQLFRKQWR